MTAKITISPRKAIIICLYGLNVKTTVNTVYHLVDVCLSAIYLNFQGIFYIFYPNAAAVIGEIFRNFTDDSAQFKAAFSIFGFIVGIIAPVIFTDQN